MENYYVIIIFALVVIIGAYAVINKINRASNEFTSRYHDILQQTEMNGRELEDLRKEIKESLEKSRNRIE